MLKISSPTANFVFVVEVVSRRGKASPDGAISNEAAVAEIFVTFVLLLLFAPDEVDEGRRNAMFG